MALSLLRCFESSDIMSTKSRIASGQNRDLTPGENLPRNERLPGCAAPVAVAAPAPVGKVWCAPMPDAGEWVVTWTRVPGAIAYETQTSLDGAQWGSGSRFSGTRAVLLVGPARRCWVRVRALGSGAPGAWSEPVMGEKADGISVTA